MDEDEDMIPHLATKKPLPGAINRPARFTKLCTEPAAKTWGEGPIRENQRP